MKIEAMGLSVSTIEKGEFYTSYRINAPINGNISNLNAQIGSYIDSQSPLLEIINPEMLQLKLSLFVTDSVTALPDEAIIRTKSGSLILVLEKQVNDSWYFTPVEVTVGRQYNGYSEIVSDTIHHKILTGGVYNINIP